MRAKAATGPSPGFTCFAAQGPRAQRSVAADLIFGSFHQGKEQSLPAAIERVRAYNLDVAQHM